MKKAEGHFIYIKAVLVLVNPCCIVIYASCSILSDLMIVAAAMSLIYKKLTIIIEPLVFET
jgi:hypothetical protein